MLLLALLACAPDNSCAAYVEAAAGCVERAGGDPATYDVASICGADDWTPALEARYGDWYACQADAWAASACDSSEAVAEAARAAAECPAG